MSVNDKQVAGSHYRSKRQHWDYVEANGLRYLEGCATKYVTRWRMKHRYSWLQRLLAGLSGLHLPTPQEDLSKSIHYIEKMIELHRMGLMQSRSHKVSIRVREFAEENNLTRLETTVIGLLTHWTNVDDLKNAILLIEVMLSDEELA